MPCWEGWQRCVPSRSWQAGACSDCAVQLRGGITQGRLMSLAMLRTRASLGLEAPEVQVEVHLSNGLPGLSIVGLPEAAVKESRERVRSALFNAGFEFPARRITLNLAPADLPKEGGRFDLPIALGILVASGQIPEEAVAAMECLGELALDGSIRAVTGVLPAALCCRKARRHSPRSWKYWRWAICWSWWLTCWGASASRRMCARSFPRRACRSPT